MRNHIRSDGVAAGHHGLQRVLQSLCSHQTTCSSTEGTETGQGGDDWRGGVSLECTRTGELSHWSVSER